jgi:sugar lactone lactonase YvrE
VRARQVTEPVHYHGEGPVWSARWGELRWVDLYAGDVLALKEDGSVTRTHVSRVVVALRPRRGGGAVLGVERGFALLDADGTVTILPPLWTDESIRMNDGACDPDGRFYCGSMADDRRPGAGALYRLDPDGSTRKVLDGVTISNGLDWSPDGSRAWYVDTETSRVWSFDYTPDGGLAGRRVFVAVDGRPDGLTVDAEGCVWVALNGGGVVHRYAGNGALVGIVEVAARRVTACTFGGPRLDRLYITTSREGLQPGEDPLAGSLFMVEPGVRGQPTREFAG